MKLSKSSLLLGALLTSPACFAQHVLPVFAGKWLRAGTSNYLGVDSCNKDHYQYNDLVKGTAQEAAIQFQSKLPPQKNCHWNPPVKSGEMRDMSPEAWSETVDDWKKVSQIPTNPSDEEWESDCVDNTGEVVDISTVVIDPIYKCPTGSRFTNDPNHNEFGCSTTPDTCDADIVGRDLNVPGISFTGHVGLAEAGWGVLEVLNDKTVIHLTDSFNNFKNTPGAPYWGTVYGLPSKSYLNPLEALTILNDGMDQSQFNPEYTLTSTYQVGHYTNSKIYDVELHRLIKATGMVQAIFRCDTFVDYAYLAGVSLNIPLSDTILPKTTYDSFINNRFIGGTPGGQESKNGHGSYILKAYQETPKSSKPGIKGQTLEQVFAHKILNVADADQASYTFFGNTNVANISKLNRLWSLAQQYEKVLPKFNYAMDLIGFSKPLPLARQLIDFYKDSIGYQKKNKILDVLSQAVVTADMEHLSSKDKQLIALIQDFIRKQLISSQDPSLIKNLINIYSNIVLPKYSWSLINQKLAYMADKKYYEHGKSYFYIPALNADRIKIRTALMTQRSQKDLFIHLIKQHPRDQVLASALTSVLYRYPVNTLSKSVVNLSKQYLMLAKPILVSKSAKENSYQSFKTIEYKQVIDKLNSM